MKTLEIVIKISPADLAPWDGAEVPVRFVISETGIAVHYPSPPNLMPEILERLRVSYVEIASSLTCQSREIFCFLLNTSGGQATYQELIDHVWPQDKYPSKGTVRQAVFQLRNSLKRLNFGYIVSGSRPGIYSIVPVNETDFPQVKK